MAEEGVRIFEDYVPFNRAREEGRTFLVLTGERATELCVLPQPAAGPIIRVSTGEFIEQAVNNPNRRWFQIWPRYSPGQIVEVIRLPDGSDMSTKLLGTIGPIVEVDPLPNGYTNYWVGPRYLHDVMLRARNPSGRI
jgi:hypothetical protein